MFYSKNLKKIKNINHCFFSKKNGFSKGIYKSLNCGRGSHDNKKNINKNLIFVSNKMGVPKNSLILMRQTHSNKVVEIKKNNYKKKIKADAMITKMKGIALGVVTADCVPIILYDVRNQIIGCVHAGWRGAYLDIVKNTIIKIKKMNSNNLIYACVGPCIGQINYEVDLVFFKNNDNKINHVGIALENHKIIHASGKVRVDNLTKEGIFLSKNKQLTHRLHSVKRIIE